MATDTTKTNKSLLNNDRTSFYTDLAYLSESYKDRRQWMAQMIWYAKKNSSLLVNPQVAQGFRENNRLIINRQDYVNLIDPPTPKDSGGTAEFFSADFKAYPIDVHLDNITTAILEKIPHNISVKINDPVAKLQEQKDKEKIIYKNQVRKVINAINQELGLPSVSESEDPYKWIEAFSKDGGKGTVNVDTIGTKIDQIRNRIETDDQLRLFMQYVYKNGLEIAFESAIQYYFINLNKWHLKQDNFIDDMKNFNLFTGMWYIDELTGRPVVKYLDPSAVYTSPFVEKNGDDILYWGTEMYITYAEFEKMVGAVLSDEQKKKILQVNKMWGNANAFGTNVSINVAWNDALKTNSQMKIGYFSVLTQEAEEFSQYYIDNNGSIAVLNPTGLNESTENVVNKPVKNKVYNVWYRCYYIPIPDTEIPDNIKIGNEGWQWLSEYVFDIRKEIDMYRYGVDNRYAKSALVIYRDLRRPSYTQIKQRFMPKIHTLWHKIQNCIVQDTNAMAWDYDLLGGMLNAIDDANEQNPQGGKALIQEMKSLKQSGLSWVKFRDKNGNLLVTDPSKLFIAVQSGHMETAEKYMLMLLSLYQQMTEALGISLASQGKTPDPRTPAAGIELSAEATDNARWYLEKPMIECAIMFGERVVQYVNCISREKDDYGYEERWKEFCDIVGFANGATIESIEDIKFQNVGLSVVNENNTLQKQMVIQMATQKAAQKEITTNDLMLILDTDNWKYQLMEMAMAEAARRKELVAEQQRQYEQQKALQDQQLQIALALNGAKAQGVNSNIETAGAVDAQLEQLRTQLKLQSALIQKNQLKDNKIEVDNNKADQNKEKDLQEPFPTVNQNLQPKPETTK